MHIEYVGKLRRIGVADPIVVWNSNSIQMTLRDSVDIQFLG